MGQLPWGSEQDPSNFAVHSIPLDSKSPTQLRGNQLSYFQACRNFSVTTELAPLTAYIQFF